MTVSPTATIETGNEAGVSLAPRCGPSGGTYEISAGSSTPGRRRDCHSAAPHSAFSRCINRNGESVPAAVGETVLLLRPPFFLHSSIVLCARIPGTAGT